MTSQMKEHQELILDGTKLSWHLERVEQWERGERIAPITIDMALTRACNYSCGFCYAMFQENDRSIITDKVINDFLEDCAEIGVKGISFVSDGESTISPVFINACKKGHELGLSMAVGDFLSTRSEIEFSNSERSRELWEVRHFPEQEKEELIEIYIKKVCLKKTL